jgi:uncharacterized repeat protein (TIGR03803 family)
MKSESKSAAGQLILAFAVALIAVAAPHAQAQTFSVVHNFTGGTGGGVPFNGLTAYGNILYGTTGVGGISNYGVVFKLNASGVETVLHNFAGGSDGATPQGQLVRGKANTFYGTTTAGGAFGAGTVFEFTGKQETVLYSFAGGKDGADPVAGLTLDAAGNLYGTTSQGGSNGNGTVFELIAPKTKGGQWTKSILYSFGTGTDGSVPVGGVTFDSAGKLYGTTSLGGEYGCGTVFQLTSGANWTESILYNFQNAADGSVPYAGLIADKSGNFYGAASQGGAGGDNGGGTIFKLTPSNGVWTFSIIYSLPGWGISGTFRNIVLDSYGNLYGTTHCDGSYNAGTVYQLTPSGGTWTYNLLYDFTGASDGQYSVSNLVISQNKLYGTTLYGGTNGNGVVYEVAP